MPSSRRMRVFGVLLFVLVVYLLFSGSSRKSDFYRNTKDALSDLERKHPHGSSDRGPGEAQGAMADRLKHAERVAKGKANEKAPTRESVMGTGAKGSVAKKTVNEESEDHIGSDEDAEVERTLNQILKRSPIIIFSKSYCPHSARAKGILLDKYNIVPAPFVVELDQHSQGPEIQAKLALMTGRRTVPNVLINGKSIGGGDDIAELDVRRELIAKVRQLGGKQMQEVAERPGHDI